MLRAMGRFCHKWISVLIVLSVVPAWADSQFRVRKMTRTDVPLGKGQCDIRLRVDSEVEVSIRGDMVNVRTISGRDARDEGSECNEPLPNDRVEGFRFAGIDGRGEVRLLAEPTRRNGYQAVVRIRDGASGEEGYHFRVSWMMTGGSEFNRRDSGDFRGHGRDDDFDNRPGGLVWNNAAQSTSRGRGTSTLAGYGSQQLFDATVSIDRGNRILVSFRTDSGRPLTFSGSVIGMDGDTLKADVATDDRSRLRGSMYLSRNPRGDFYRINLEATDGQSRLTLNWNRR